MAKSSSLILNNDTVQKKLSRITHQIIEENYKEKERNVLYVLVLFYITHVLPSFKALAKYVRCILCQLRRAKVAHSFGSGRILVLSR